MKYVIELVSAVFISSVMIFANIVLCLQCYILVQ